MATQHNNNDADNGIALAVDDLDPNPIGPTRVEEYEKVETLEVGHPIEEGVEKISLVGASQTCVTPIQGNGNEDESESESESEASSSGGSSSSSSSSDSDGDGDSDEDGDKKKEEGEIEEGELRDSDDDESEDDKSEGGDKLVGWSMVDDDGDDDIDVVDYDDDARGGGGPIKSKNELEVFFLL